MLAVVIILLLVAAIVLRGGDTTTAGSAFNQVNLNNDNEITASEMRKFKAALKQFGVDVDTEDELRRVLARYDTNPGNATSGGGLDRTEFQELVAGETST